MLKKVEFFLVFYQYNIPSNFLISSKRHVHTFYHLMLNFARYALGSVMFSQLAVSIAILAWRISLLFIYFSLRTNQHQPSAKRIGRMSVSRLTCTRSHSM
jgi:hypothetical protein